MTEDKEKKDSIKYTDLDDVVYGYLKTQVLDGYKILGGRIKEPKVTHLKAPKKLIQICLLHVKSNERTYPEYNYKKLERILQQHLRKAKYAKQKHNSEQADT